MKCSSLKSNIISETNECTTSIIKMLFDLIYFEKTVVELVRNWKVFLIYSKEKEKIGKRKIVHKPRTSFSYKLECHCNFDDHSIYLQMIGIENEIAIFTLKIVFRVHQIVVFVDNVSKKKNKSPQKPLSVFNTFFTHSISFWKFDSSK